MRNNWSGTLSAFSIGVGIGAIVAVIFAPKSGEDTRAYLREKAQDGVDEAVARGKQVARRAQKTVDKARDLVTEAVDAGERTYRDARNS